jgi:hypothetical protein
LQPGVDIAVYDVIGLPPLFAGAVKETVAEFCPVAVAVPIVGAPGALAEAPVRPKLNADPTALDINKGIFNLLLYQLALLLFANLFQFFL